MKVRIGKDAIVNILQKVQSIVSPKTTLPILSNILFRTSEDKVFITATDLGVSVQAYTDAEISEQGATTLPARKMFSIFKELAPSEIDIQVDDNNVAEIRAGASFFKLLGMSDEEFPPLPVFEGEHIYTIAQVTLKEMLARTSYAASTDETRYVLNGVLLSFKGEKLTIVATDGRRLALVDKEMEFPEQAERDMVIPSKTVAELIKNLGDDGDMKIKTTPNQIAFEFNEMIIVSNLIDGHYPNFRQVIPSSSDYRVSLEREGLIAAVRRAAILTNDKSNSVKLIFSENQVEVLTQTPDVGEAREVIPVKYAGEEVSVAFNPEFIIAPLKTLHTDEVYFEFTDELSPGVIKTDVPFLYVIMPIRMS